MKNGANYSYDKTEQNSLSDIEETIEKNINNSSISRKNKFKEKDEKKFILINKNKYDKNKNDKNKNENEKNEIIINRKQKNNINIEKLNNNNKKDIEIDNINHNHTISNDVEIKYSKSNNIRNNIIKPLSQSSTNKNDLQVISVKNIVKLVDDVNQSINKILDGSQILRRSSIREASRSFIINKNIEIKEFLNKSPSKNIENDEKEKIKDYKDISNLNKNKNLNEKCKINYNVFSNDINSKKTNRKIKNNTAIPNLNNLTSSKYKKNIENEKEKEIKNYNSYKNNNNKSIKKIILNSSKYKTKETEKKNEYNKINNDISTIIIKENKNKNRISFINIIKENSNILMKILQYLSFKNKIYFLSTNKYLLKERINLLINKKEEIFLILQLKKKETIEEKIKSLKNNNSKKSLLKEFILSKDSIKNLKKLNESQNLLLFKGNHINNNKITEINIIYKILFLFLGERKLVEISDDNIFWKKCCKYFMDISNNKKIGDFIIEKANNFNFDNKTINLIGSILIGNKNNIINGYYAKLCKTTGLIIPLIKETLEYCGIITNDLKNISNKMIEHLQYNKMLINRLDNIINFHTNI